jgi:hypothetical protein
VLVDDNNSRLFGAPERIKNMSKLVSICVAIEVEDKDVDESYLEEDDDYGYIQAALDILTSGPITKDRGITIGDVEIL